MAEEEKKAAAAAVTKPEKKDKQVGKFTRGDHSVHILLQKGKKFIPDCPDDRVVNLIVEVQVGDQKQYSTSKDEVAADSDSAVMFDEHLFFELKNLEPNKAKNTSVTFKVFNRGYIKNELIGQAIFDLSSIYFAENHKVEHTWAALENPDAEDFENMKGLLKISANAIGPKDNAQKLEIATGPEPAKMKMFMSSNIKRTFNQLTISVIEARDLPEFGMFSQSLESYFKVHYGGGNPIKTDVVNQIEKKISCNQSILLPVATPVLADRLVIEVFDYNMFPASDNKIGALIFSAKQLIADGSKPGGFFIWKSLYGSPADNTNDAAEDMNENPEIASDWKGMVLFHISAVENDKPKKGIETMLPDIRKQALDFGFFEMDTYEMVIEIGQGVTLPVAETDYRVQVSVHNNDWKSAEPKEKKGEYVRWSCRSGDGNKAKPDESVIKWQIPKNPFSLFTGKSAESLGQSQQEFRIFVYLLDTNDTPICFWHGKLSEFMNKNAQWKWLQLKPDRSYEEVENDHEAGLVSVKISANLVKEGQSPTNFKKELAWKKDPPRRIGAYQLRTFIFQARDLPAADSDGSSDPFIRIFNTTGENVSTAVIEDNVNPIFMEVKEVGMDFQDYENFSDAPPVIFDVMDADEGLWESADFLGRCTIFLTAIGDDLSRGEEVPVPKWYPIKFGTDENSPACGEILCSFSLTPGDMILPPVEAADKHMDTMVQKLDYDVFINCLGLRQLDSIGLMPIQKAFVKFMVKSLTDPKKSGQLENVKTNPGPSGSNPNINSVVKINIPLPTEELYCPTLSCTVYDQVFLGFSQPMVGTFGIPLGKIMQDCKKENEELLIKAAFFVDRLERFERGVPMEDGSSEEQRPTMVEEVKIEVEVAQTAKPEDDDELLAEVADDSMLIADNDDKKRANGAQLGPNGEEVKKSAPGKTKMNKKKDSTSSKRDQAKIQDAIAKSQKAVRIAAAKEAMKTVDTSHNVSIPNYIYDPQLRVYREVMPPKNELFKKVGFNDQDLIKEIMVLMNQIPHSAAKSVKIQKKNSMLSSKIAKEAKALEKKSESAAEAGAQDGDVSKADEDAATDLMAKIYEKTNLHYRRFFEDELENNTDIFSKNAFYNFDITRGQSRGVEKSWFSFGGGEEDESGQASTVKVVGKFKGTIEIINNELKAEFEEQKEELLTKIFDSLSRLYEGKTGTKKDFNLNSVETSEDKAALEEDLSRIGLKLPTLVNFMEDVSFGGMIKNLLTKKTEAIAHVYLIQGYEFASRDIGSASDPYLIVRCGDTEDNDCDNYQNDEPNPKFMKRLDFTVDFPGAPPLEIEAYDYDLLFGDDLIGKTTIDLDDRFFNPKWQALDEKPIETRELYHMSSKMNQGVIDMWVDIDPATKTSDVGKVWDICREPENQFEVRLSVFKCANVPNEDWEGTTDAYIKCFISDKDKQETDTHYRCTTGNPSFNYRLLFGVTTPTIKPFILTMQAWDRDLLKSNDLICQWELNITEMVRDSKITTGPINLTKKYYEESLKKRLVKEGDPEPLAFITKEKDGNPDSTIILEAISPNPKHKGTVKIYLDLRVVPGVYAATNRVGAAREEPNVDPNLPQPVGRFKLSLNPFSMLNQMCGAALRRKIWCCICCVFCLMVCYFVFPLLASFKTLFLG